MSTKSLELAKKQLQDFADNYKKGIKNAIKTATEAMYNKVLQYCYENNISNYIGNIHWEYDEEKNVGRVWTNDMVIIFNEMGTGIVGSNNPHPKLGSWKYDVNEHGEKGWKYPKEDGTYGWTRCLPSKHMFYSAFEDIKNEIGEYVSVELQKTTGNMYYGVIDYVSRRNI